MSKVKILLVVCLLLMSCDKQNKQTEEDYTDRVINPTYTPTPSSFRTCPKCGTGYDRDNIFAFPNEAKGVCLNCYYRDHPDERPQSTQTLGNAGNQYYEGYEQGKEDAVDGLEYNPSGYGGNGQFEKGYEDGYYENN